MMPGMDGMDLLENVKTLGTGYRSHHDDGLRHN